MKSNLIETPNNKKLPRNDDEESVILPGKRGTLSLRKSKRLKDFHADEDSSDLELELI